MDITILLVVILILSVALLTAVFPRLHRPQRSVTKARQEVLDWTVGPDQRDFLLVNGRVFYGSINGFEYEEEHVYQLRVEEYDLGSSTYGYRLVEIVSKQPIPRKNHRKHRSTSIR